MAEKRGLKSGEEKVLAQVFVKTLPLDRIIITDKLGLGDRPYTLPQLLTKEYHVNVGSYYGEDMSASEYGRALLVHECTHVWQGVHGIFEWDYVLNSVACQGLSVFKDGTAYDYEPGKDWMWYGAEKQAQIVEDWYRGGMSISSGLWRYVRDNVRKPGFGGKAYFFKDAKYMRWTIGEGADSGYPKVIEDQWNGFVHGCDAAVSRVVGSKEYYYFFKGDEYTKWEPGSGQVSGYPKRIADEWESSFMREGVTAALSCDNNQAYFFRGDKYIRYTFGEGQDDGYPRRIADSWESPFIANGFDTCLYWGNGKAYFFKGDQYLRHTMGEGADPGYPKGVGEHWAPFLRSGLKGALLRRADAF